MSDEKTQETEGEKKFREMGEKLKAEKEQAAEEQKEKTALAMNQLAQLRQNSQLAQMYSENAKVGADNLSGELPLLKVHAVGKSTKNELSDGTEPNDGWFFYKPTGEQFETVRCHILTISKGFRAEGMQQGGQTKQVFNQVIGGVIIGDGGEMKPFVMYVTGLKLSPMWEFGKAAAKYTRMKPISIPMFALTVKMTTEKVKNNYGKSWIINFEIEKLEDGSPVLIMDPGEFQYLKDNVEIVEDTIASLIDAKAIKEDDDDDFPQHVQEATGAEPVGPNKEPVNPEDIPF